MPDTVDVYELVPPADGGFGTDEVFRYTTKGRLQGIDSTSEWTEYGQVSESSAQLDVPVEHTEIKAQDWRVKIDSQAYNVMGALPNSMAHSAHNTLLVEAYTPGGS